MSTEYMGKTATTNSSFFFWVGIVEQYCGVCKLVVYNSELNDVRKIICLRKNLCFCKKNFSL